MSTGPAARQGEHGPRPPEGAPSPVEAFESEGAGHELELVSRLQAAAVLSERLERLRQATEAAAAEQRRLVASVRRWVAGGVCAVLLGLLGALAALRAQGGEAAQVLLGPTPAETDLRRRVAHLEQQLEETRGERNDQIAETERLRSELVERDQRLHDVVGRVGALGVDLDRPAPAATLSRTDERTPDPLVSGVNGALAASGVSDLTVVEAGGIEQGELVDLLLIGRDRTGQPEAARTVASARLVERDSRYALRLLPAGGEPEDVALPTVDLDAWSRVGVVPPAVVVPLDEVRSALDRLLSGQDLKVVGLGGFADGTLLDLALDELDGTGAARRHLEAARASVVEDDGPALLLEQGTVEENGDARPFWRGSTRLPLPGADLAAWRRSTGG